MYDIIKINQIQNHYSLVLLFCLFFFLLHAQLTVWFKINFNICYVKLSLQPDFPPYFRPYNPNSTCISFSINSITSFVSSTQHHVCRWSETLATYQIHWNQKKNCNSLSIKWLINLIQKIVQMKSQRTCLWDSPTVWKATWISSA